MGIDLNLQAAVRGMVILVVEDDPDTKDGLCALLELYGTRVTCASSATEAVHLVGGGHHYDVVVSDLELPGPDGLWLVAEIRRLANPNAPPGTILLTGSARPSVERLAMQAGYDICLRKPAGADSLLRAVARLRGPHLP